MTPRTWAYADVGEDAPVRDRPYESFGEQGVALPTYGADRVQVDNRDEAMPRGEARFDLGEELPRGPKNWQRRDDRIHDDVCVRLTDDGHVDAHDVEVVVHHGEVTLSGTVPDRAQRDRALRVADSVRGVVDVVNHLHVARDASQRQGGR